MFPRSGWSFIGGIEPETTFPILIIDAASPTTIVGLGMNEGDWSWDAEARESGIALFASVERLLKGRSIPIGALGTIVFCEGPGSMLGIRTVAMALRTWVASGMIPTTTLMTYSSLALVAAGLRRNRPNNAFTVAIDARRQSWFCLHAKGASATDPEIRRVPHESINQVSPPVFLPAGFPLWNPRPESWTDCSYEPRRLESAAVRRQILRLVTHPDAYQPESPIYQKWTPEVIRTPGPRPRSEQARS